MTISKLYFLDGRDLWDTFNIGVESGSDDFLKIPERKDSITHNWLDEDGTDVDLSRTFFKSREVNLHCFSQNANREKFWENYNSLITLFRKPGSRRLTITRHNKDYFVYYKDNNAYQSFRFTVMPSGSILTKFTLTLAEPKPTFEYQPTFLTDEAGRFIIT